VKRMLSIFCLAALSAHADELTLSDAIARALE
jgi:hypothetical protein